MQPEKTAAGVPAPHRIELSLRDVNGLFNTMDPSPFHEKDLDHDAEEFILSWALEFPVHEPVTLVLHLGEGPCGPKERGMVEQAVHHYFAYRARLNQLEFRQLVSEGRRSLIIGLIFLGVCLCISEALSRSRTLS